MEPLETAVSGFACSWELLVTACPGGSCSYGQGVLTVDTRIPVPPFNGVWVLDPAAEPARVLAAVDAVASWDVPWNVQLRPGCAPEIEAGLAARGLEQVAEIPFMTLTALDLPTALDFRPVVTFADVDTTLSFMEQAFEMPPELTRQAFPMAMMFLPGVTGWLGEAEGAVVTTALQVDVAGTVGVFNVATPSALRGRGYGGAATRQAIGAGLAGGASVGWLQASPLGEPVYTGLGFETPERWTQWLRSR